MPIFMPIPLIGPRRRETKKKMPKDEKTNRPRDRRSRNNSTIPHLLKESRGKPNGTNETIQVNKQVNNAFRGKGLERSLALDKSCGLTGEVGGGWAVSESDHWPGWKRRRYIDHNKSRGFLNNQKGFRKETYGNEEDVMHLTTPVLRVSESEWGGFVGRWEMSRGEDTPRSYQVVWFPCAAGRPSQSLPWADHLGCRELLDLLREGTVRECGGNKQWSISAFN